VETTAFVDEDGDGFPEYGRFEFGDLYAAYCGDKSTDLHDRGTRLGDALDGRLRRGCDLGDPGGENVNFDCEFYGEAPSEKLTPL